MPLVTKARPAWQAGPRPPTKEQRDSFAISASHERRFSSAFAVLLESLLTPSMLKIIDQAVRTEPTVESILNKIPFFDPDSPKTFAVWEKFASKLAITYEEVIRDAAKAEARRRGWKLELQKADAPKMPVNPTMAQFIRARSLTTVVDMSGKEKDRVREILAGAFEKGTPARDVVSRISNTVGLTKKQVQMVDRRVEAAKAAGVKGRRRELERRFSRDMRMQRARTIARTETRDAITQGQLEGWRQASAQGLTPPGTRKRWVAFVDDRISDICEDLNGEEVGINENFSAGISGPPAHPNCRSTLELVFP